MDKLCMKFSALNVDFNGPSLDLLSSRKPAHERYPLKDVIWSLLASLPWKPVADRHGLCCLSQQAYSGELFSHK